MPSRHPPPSPATLLLAATLTAGALGAVPTACTTAHRDREEAAQAAGDGWSVKGLPLIEVPARRPGRSLALLMSGDGNWAELDRGVAATLADSGIAVVGLRSRSYLRDQARTPETLTADVTRVLRHYMQAWGRDSVVLVGYSRGADFAPFVANRLPTGLRDRLELVVMLAPAPNASFHFHWLDLVRDTPRATDLPVLPELVRLGGVPVLCVYGRDEEVSACRDTSALGDPEVRVVERAGGHHFDGDYSALGNLAVAALRGR